MHINPSLAIKYIDEAAGHLAETQFSGISFRGTKMGYYQQLYYDGGSFGITYLMRSSKRAIREGHWALGTAAALVVPFTAIAAGAAIITTTFPIFGLIGVDYGARPRSYINYLRKHAAFDKIRASQSALCRQLRELAKNLVQCGSCDAAQVRVLGEQVEQREDKRIVMPNPLNEQCMFTYYKVLYGR